MSIDIAIINVPYTLTRAPHSAPALLKGSLVAAGFTCTTLDFNIRFINQFSEHADFPTFERYFLENIISPDKKEIIQEAIGLWVDEILLLNPTYIGISVFTYQCRTASRIFCEIIRSKNPNIQIILGGQGISQGGINGKNAFPLRLQEEGLIDYFIKSEGEVSLIELLKGNKDRIGINSDTFKQVDIIDQLEYPNYDDYDFSSYESKYLIITGSRGCVRQCSFCDIHQHWDYRFRQGKSIVKEMIALSEKYKIYDFVFSDSLVNGNTKEFKVFLKELSEHNAQAKYKISWKGQYIIKPYTVDNEEHWNLMSRSNCQEIWIGVESGSEKVRREMNKAFTNDDLYHTIDNLVKYKISCKLLMFVGYPTESEKDFEDTLNLIRKYKHLAGNIVKTISLADTVSILPGTPLSDTANQNNIIVDEKYENNWLNLNYPELTLAERIRRTEIAKKLAAELGYTSQENDFHNHLDYLRDRIDIFNQRLKIKKILKLKEI